MPGAGAVQVTVVALACLQAEGGIRPLASALWLARMSAAISALLVGFGFGDIDAITALVCGPDRLSPAQVPSPARTRTTAASTAIQRGWRYQRGSRGPAGGPAGRAADGPAAGRTALAGWPGPPYWAGL